MAPTVIDPVQLLMAIESQRKTAATRPQDISLNELADMYSSNELHIQPEYQRLFRWSTAKQSQFIESLLLEMPVPPLFVIEVADNKWELIDGLQRLSTYLRFRGQLKELPKIEDDLYGGDGQLCLEGCDIVKELNGCRYDDLPSALQIRLKRAFLRVEVVRRESAKHFRYHMFKRLNTGGEPLSDQEIRNCTIRLLGEEFNTLLVALASGTADFKACIKDLTPVAVQEKMDQELVLRFFAFKNHMAVFRHDIADFLTAYMEGVTEKSIDFDYVTEKAAFEKTFAVLTLTLGEHTSQAWVVSRYRNAFSMHHFEAFSVGVARHADRLDPADGAQMARIKVALDAVKKDPDFIESTKGGGKNSPGLYKAKIAKVANAVEAVL